MIGIRFIEIPYEFRRGWAQPILENRDFYALSKGWAARAQSATANRPLERHCCQTASL
jgi:hypothetical protein